MKISRAIIPAVLFYFLLPALLDAEPGGGKRAKDEASLPLVEVLPVKIETTQRSSEYVGRVEAAVTANHLAPFPGKVEKILVGPGEQVKRGQDVLILSRVSMGQDFGDYRSKANVSGIIYTVPVDLGTDFQQGALLFTVVDSTKKVVRLLVSDQDIANLQVGKTVAIGVGQGGETRAGKVKTISILPKDMTGLFPVEIDVSELPLQNLGMMASVSVSGDKQRGFPAPSSAIGGEGEHRFAYVVTGDDRIQKRSIKVLTTPAGDFLITDGIEDGEQIVRFLTDKIADGIAVKVRKQGNGKRGS